MVFLSYSTHDIILFLISSLVMPFHVTVQPGDMVSSNSLVVIHVICFCNFKKAAEDSILP